MPNFEIDQNLPDHEADQLENPPIPETKMDFNEVELAKIRTLNDIFRQTFQGGSHFLFTQGIIAYPPEDQAAIVNLVRGFNTFTKGNDPHKEHDFGIVQFKGESIYWKIDYYDKSLEYHSLDKSDPSVTERVLTVYLASEH